MLLVMRAGLLAGITALLALCVFSLLAGRSSDQGLRDLEVERIRFLVSSLRDTVEANLGLGLPIQDLDGLQAVIERDRSRERDLRVMEIVGPMNVTLFSTDRGAIGEAVPLPWQVAIEERHSPHWLAEYRGETAIGEVIENDFGQVVGHVVVVVASEKVNPPLSVTFGLALLGWPAALAAGLAAFALAVGVSVFRRRPIKRAVWAWQAPWTNEMERRAEAMKDEALPSLYGASLRARQTNEAAARRLADARQGLTELDNED